MARISFSGQHKSLQFIISWYNDQKLALIDLRSKIIDSIIHSKTNTTIDSKFFGLSLGEIEDYFTNSEMELEHLACFDLISATEALLRIDFFRRAYNKSKSSVSKIFREIYKDKKYKISLEEDILENWKKISKKKIFSDFLGLLHYRHWLAHGRYWTPKFGRIYSFDVVSDICENIFNQLDK